MSTIETNIHSKNKPGKNRPARFIAALLITLIYGLYLVRFGYGYGASDQDDFIPYLLRLMDPALFENDWYVQTQTATFSVRTYFVWLLRVFTLIMPVWLAVLLVYLASWTSIVVALYKLGDLLTSNRLAALISVAITCVLTPFWTLGGNDLVHSMLVPSMAAWAIGLWSFVFYLRRLYVPAAVMAGLATLFQALIGMQIMLVIGCLLCFGYASNGYSAKDLKIISQSSFAYLITAAAALIPLISQQLAPEPTTLSSAISSTLAPEPSTFYIIALFRAPHHYLFYSFDKVRLVQFFVLVLAGYLALLKMQQHNPSFNRLFFTRVLTIVSVCCMIAFLGTEVHPLLAVAKLQLFKMTILIKVIMVISLSAFIVKVLPAKLSSWIEQTVFERPLRLSALFVVAILALVIIQPDRLSQKVYPWSTQNTPEIRLAQWAQGNTNEGEVFAVPPSWSSFRSHAKRAIVINFKSFPFLDDEIPVWFNRLTDMAPVKTPERADPNLLKALDLRYNTRSPNVLETLSFEYEFDYIIRNTPLPGSSSFSVVHKEQEWYVYKVSPQRLAIR